MVSARPGLLLILTEPWCGRADRTRTDGDDGDDDDDDDTRNHSSQTGHETIERWTTRHSIGSSDRISTRGEEEGKVINRRTSGTVVGDGLPGSTGLEDDGDAGDAGEDARLRLTIRIASKRRLSQVEEGVCE